MNELEFYIAKPCEKCGKIALFTPRVTIDTWDCYFCKHQELIKKEESTRLRKKLEELNA